MFKRTTLLKIKTLSFGVIAGLLLGTFAVKSGHIQNLFYTAITQETSAQVMSAPEAYSQTTLN